MKVEPFGYPLDDSLLKKINIMIKRCTAENPKRDAVLLCEGPEGEGKTTYAVAVAYYVKWKTGREFDHTKVFFDVEKMIQHLQATDNQIAIWDEPALQAMNKDSLTTMVKNLERLLMMARKKRHFIIFNLAYFNKFSDYIVWQRPLGMIHVYSRNEIEAGRYCYINKKNLEYLYEGWRTKHHRDYKMWSSKRIRGTFPDVLNPNYKHNVLSNFKVDEYEKSKDEAIMSIGKTKKENKEKIALQELRYKIASLPKVINSKDELAMRLGINSRRLREWILLKKDENLLAN